MSFVFYNSQLLSADVATISQNDRAFKFGDGVFETIRISGGKIIWWESHLQRLNDGLKSLKIECDCKGLLSQSRELIKKNNITSGFLRISISRGDKSLGYLPDKDNVASIFIQTTPLRDVKYEPKNLMISSYKKIPDVCLPSNAKTVANGLNSSLARMEANENGCFESVMLTVDEKVAECSSGNIFWYKNKVLYTPKSNLIKGVTRNQIIKHSDIEVLEGDYNIMHLKEAEEVFITNVSWILLPVKSIDPLGFLYQKQKTSNILRSNLIKNIENQDEY